MLKRNLNLLVVSIIIVYFIFNLIFVSNTKELNNDFKIYYFAVKSYQNKINFYDTSAIKIMLEKGLLNKDSSFAKEISESRFSFVYPPLTIHFFKIFTIDNYQNSVYFFNLFKFILLIAIFFFWRKFINLKNLPEFLIFALFVFRTTLGKDFYIGQITVIEQFFLWIAFGFYLKRKYFLFGIFVLFASVFKVTPLFFLVLLLITDDKKRFHYFFASSAIFIGFLALNYLFDPFLFSEFVGHQIGHFETNRIDARGLSHPSSYSMIEHIISKFLEFRLKPNLIKILVWGSFGILSVIITLVSYLKIKKLSSFDVKNTDNEIIKIFVVIFVYALINPKFMFYSYIILIVPTFYIIKRTQLIKPFYLYFFILILAGNCSYPGLDYFANIYWNYYPLILSFGIWIIYMCENFKNQNFQKQIRSQNQ